jgi:hypothetical protein
MLAHFYLMKKIRQSVAQFWFGLRDVGVDQIFYSRTVIQRTMLTFPHFWSTVWRKKVAVCAHTNRDPSKQEVGFIFL